VFGVACHDDFEGSYDIRFFVTFDCFRSDDKVGFQNILGMNSSQINEVLPKSDELLFIRECNGETYLYILDKERLSKSCLPRFTSDPPTIRSRKIGHFFNMNIVSFQYR
jgi:hypothetical protein